MTSTTRKAYDLKGGDFIEVDGASHMVVDTYAADGLRTTIRSHPLNLAGRFGMIHYMTVANDTEITEGK